MQISTKFTIRKKIVKSDQTVFADSLLYEPHKSLSVDINSALMLIFYKHNKQ